MKNIGSIDFEFENIEWFDPEDKKLIDNCSPEQLSIVKNFKNWEDQNLEEEYKFIVVGIDKTNNDVFYKYIHEEMKYFIYRLVPFKLDTNDKKLRLGSFKYLIETEDDLIPDNEFDEVYKMQRENGWFIKRFKK